MLAITMNTVNPSLAGHSDAASSLWRNAPYLLLMTGKTSQLVGNGTAVFAVPLIAFGITGSVLGSGIIGAISEAGLLLAILPAGVVADRVDRRRLLLTCSAIGLIVWLSLWLAEATGMLTAAELAAGLLVAAAVSAFYAPTESAGIRYVVSSEQLGTAMAAMQGRGAVASLVSGPLGGLLYGLSRALPFLGSAIGYLLAGVTTLLVRVPLNDRRSHERRVGAVASLVDGFRFVTAVPIIRTAIGVVALLNLAFGGTFVSINLHLVAIHTAPLLIALVDVAAGVAMLIGSIVAPSLVKRFPSGPLAIVCLAPSVLGCFGLALSNEYAQFVLLAFAMSLFIAPANAGLLGYMSAITPQNMQARMNSVLSLSSIAVAPLAPLLGGVFLSIVGLGWSVAVFAAMMLIGFVMFAANRAVRRVGLPDSWEADLVEWPPADHAS
ncbi:Predicted arabinose efflux permease, MFS family [Paramicrobacterium humi]|uniref:Multidrug efflux pump Tap n=1 Tax=Paramicrobacterium humi TaxID=640635 RepID=A0A1H4T8P6_9MICO|nr:MFS transporter [Microbacterium humi]SEC52668.1 Predicted arabinose efflux permease, MFS family [Microbacterium humi]